MAKPWNRISASQLKTAALCPRKWWFDKLSDLPKPTDTAAFVEGKRIHSQVEAYLKEGTLPSDPRALALSKHYRPHSHTHGIISEQQVNVGTDRGLSVPLLGYIDLIDKSAMPHTLGIVDFKSVKDWKWAKTEQELQTDLQMVPYAVWAFDTYKPVHVVVAHLQVHKATSQTAEVSAMLGKRDVMAVWDNTIVPLSHDMAKWALAESPVEVPAVITACGAFGGCPYLSVCQRGQASPSPFAGIGRVKASTTIPLDSQGTTPMSKLQDLIKARSAARGLPTLAVVTTPPAPAPAVVAPAPTPAIVAPAALVEVPPAIVIAPAKPAAKVVDYEAVADAIEAAFNGRPTIPAKELRAIVAQVSGLERVAWSHVEQATATRWPGALTLQGLPAAVITAAIAAFEVEVDGDALARLEAPAAPAAPAVLASFAEFCDIVQVLDVVPPVVVEAPPVVVAVEAPPVVVASRGYHLLVDVGTVTVPPGWVVQTLEQYLAPIIASFEKSTGGPAFLRDFRAGERTVAHMASLALPAAGTLLLVDSLNSVWKEVSQALVPKATAVYRGLR